jgi:hypothetical protein
MSSGSGSAIFSQLIKETRSKPKKEEFMDNKINDSQTEGREIFETKLTLSEPEPFGACLYRSVL